MLHQRNANIPLAGRVELLRTPRTTSTSTNAVNKSWNFPGAERVDILEAGVAASAFVGTLSQCRARILKAGHVGGEAWDVAGLANQHENIVLTDGVSAVGWHAEIPERGSFIASARRAAVATSPKDNGEMGALAPAYSFDGDQSGLHVRLSVVQSAMSTFDGYAWAWVRVFYPADMG